MLKDLIDRTFWPLVLTLLFGLTALYLGTAIEDTAIRLIGPPGEHADAAVGVLAWLSAGVLGARVLNLLFWDLAVARATGADAPRLAKQLTTVLVLLAAVTGIIAFVLQWPVSGILTTSGAVGLLAAFAARSLILDLFSGIAINLERPFNAGEYVHVQIRGLNNVFGRVEETNWRTTRLLTPEGSIQVVPNSTLGASVLTNFSRPTPIGEFELLLTLDPAVEPGRALRVLEAGLMNAVAAGGPLSSPEPKVRVSAIRDHGIGYKLKYFIDPRRGGPGKVRHVVLANVLAHLRRAGIRPAFPKMEMLNTPTGEGLVAADMDPVNALALASLFDTGDAEQMRALADSVEQRAFNAGDIVVAAGEPAGDVFIVAEGYLEGRHRAAAAGIDIALDEYGPGDVFGGGGDPDETPPRAVVAVSPAVLLVLSEADLSRLDAAQPGLRERVSSAGQARAEAAAGALEAHLKRHLGEHEEKRKQMMVDLMGQVRAFFGASVTGSVAKGWRRLTGGRADDAFARAMMAACALVATADGTVDEAERDHVRGLFDSIGLSNHIDIEHGMAMFEQFIDRLAADDADALGDMLAEVRRVRDEKRSGEMILSVCRALSSADGYADEDEVLRIGRIAEALGLADRNAGMFDEAISG